MDKNCKFAFSIEQFNLQQYENKMISFNVRFFVICLILFSCKSNNIFAQNTEQKTPEESKQKEMSLSLSQAITYAQNNSYQVQQADKDVLKARKRVWESIATGLPQIDGSLDYQYNIQRTRMAFDPGIFGGGGGQSSAPQSIEVGTKNSFVGGVQLTQLILDGSYIIGLQAAKTYKQISELSKQKTALSVKEATSNAYWNVLVAKKSLELATENLDNQKNNLNEVEESYKVGLVPEEDAQQLNLLVSNLDTERERAQRNLAIMYDMLKYVIGLDMGIEVKTTETIEDLIGLNLNFLDIQQAFDQKNNIDFVIAQNQSMSQKQLYQLEKTYSMPSLSGFINYKQNSFFLGGSGNWFGTSMAGVSLKVPIFSSLSKSAKIAQAKIEYEKALISEQELSQKLALDVRSATSDYQYALKQYMVQTDNVDLAKKILEKEQIKYSAGLTTSYRVTELTNQLIESQNRYFNAMLSLNQAKNTLDQLYYEQKQ